MEVAKVLAGYSLGEADMLRRAMGKKIKAEMDAQRERFVKGCVDGALTKAKANEIFDLLAKFADYGFNKSHAAAYALLTYQTAYSEGEPSGGVPGRRDAARHRRHRQARRVPSGRPAPRHHRGAALHQRLGRQLRGARRPHPLRAGGDQGRRPGRRRGPGGGARRRPFKDLACLARRLNPRMLNKRTLENLVAAGAMDNIEPDRARACAAIEPMMKLAQGRPRPRAPASTICSAASPPPT